MSNTITDYKLCKWYNSRKRCYLYGIDVKVNNKWVHLQLNGKKKQDNFFENKNDANKVKRYFISLLNTTQP